MFSLATIIKGGLRRIAEDPSSAEDNAYFKLLLNDGNPGESFEILQALSYDSMQYGLASETVTNFCQNAYDFCKESLTPRELALTQNLDPFISSRKNMSDYIHSLKGSTQDKYSHLHDLYLGSLKTLKGFL